MAISRSHTWAAAEVLLASDLNAEYNNILNNAADLVSPFTKAISMGGFALNFDAANTMSLVSSTKGLNLSSTTAINDVFTIVASATTPDIWTAVGALVNYTGTATATGFAAAPQAGAIRRLVCAGAAVFTAGANMLIQGVTSGSNYTAAAGDIVDVHAITTTQFRLTVRLASGLPSSNTQSANAVYAGPSTGTAAIPTFRAVTGFDLPLRSYLSGLTLSTAGGSATMTTAAGQATDSTNAQGMTLASSIGKTTSAWAVGTGNGGLDTGAIANSTWYHFYLIMRTDTGVVDVLFSTSASAPTMPASYTYKRRIGSGKTDGSAQWIAFTQDGDYFRWAASILDVNQGTPGAAAVSRTLTVPTGVNVFAMMNVQIIDTAAVENVHLSDLAATDEAASATAAPLTQLQSPAAGVAAYELMTIRTNTSAQIRSRVGSGAATCNLRIATLGWTDRRGRDA